MPRSKHRRKGIAKATRHPGRGHMPPDRPTPEEVARRQFANRYTAPFHDRWRGDGDGDGPHQSGYMLDIIAGEAFRGPGEIGSVSKPSVFAEFLVPLPEDEKPRSIEVAEAALAFLVEHGFALVDGDQITVPAKFHPSEDGESPQTVILDPHVAGTG